MACGGSAWPVSSGADAAAAAARGAGGETKEATMAVAVPRETAGAGEALATYRAAVVHSFTEPLVVEQVPMAALEPGQIRVKVEATGLCHTDIHAAHGDWPVKPAPPFVPGHEGVGIVTELGP